MGKSLWMVSALLLAVSCSGSSLVDCSSAPHRATLESLAQLWSVSKELGSLGVGEPASVSLASLGPVRFLFGDGDFEELVASLWGVLAEGAGRAGVGDVTKVFLDSDHNTRLFPGFSGCSSRCCLLILLPTSLR
jgi:hypothetical protein